MIHARLATLGLAAAEEPPAEIDAYRLRRKAAAKPR